MEQPIPPEGYKLVKGIDIKDRVPERAMVCDAGHWFQSAFCGGELPLMNHSDYYAIPAAGTLLSPPPCSSLADARMWLAEREGRGASVVIYDPPYAVGTPVRGKEDGAAGSVFAPFGFLHETLRSARAALREGGIVVIFADWRRMADMGYLCSTVGLRPSTCIAWTRKRPGTGGLLRSAWDPILIASRGVPDAVDRAAVRNVIEADYPSKRRHPYEKPAAIFEALLPRVCRPGSLVLDPFAGSGVSGEVATRLGYQWEGCDVDPAFCRTNAEVRRGAKDARPD